MSARSKYFITRVALFVYGSGFHLALLKLFPLFDNKPTQNVSVVSRPPADAAIALLGGAWLAALMLPLVRWIRAHDQPDTFAVVWRASVRGVLTTLLAFETLYILISLYFALVFRSGSPGGLGLLDGFLLALI